MTARARPMSEGMWRGLTRVRDDGGRTVLGLRVWNALWRRGLVQYVHTPAPDPIGYYTRVALTELGWRVLAVHEGLPPPFRCPDVDTTALRM